MEGRGRAGKSPPRKSLDPLLSGEDVSGAMLARRVMLPRSPETRQISCTSVTRLEMDIILANK